MVAILKNQTVRIAIAIILILAVVYFMGRRSGKAAANNGSWFTNLFADPEKPATINVDGDEPADNIQHITDAIHQSFEAHRWYSKNGEAINNAFAVFNALPVSGKVSVINDWNQRYFGTDRPGWGTGNYGTIRTEINTFYDEGLQPEVAKALGWMQSYKIN